MGGSIAIAARFNDGQAICVDGWTNFIPNMIMNETTLSGDDSVVRETLLEVAGHENYAGPQPFRSRGYGIVVIDFQSREIHSKQGYTTFGDKFLNQLLDINASGWKDGVFVNVISDQMGSLLDAGRVMHVGSYDEPKEPVVLDRAAALVMLDRDHASFMRGGMTKYERLAIRTDPFAVIDHPEDGGLKAMKDRLSETGFPLDASQGLNGMLRPRGRNGRNGA